MFRAWRLEEGGRKSDLWSSPVPVLAREKAKEPAVLTGAFWTQLGAGGGSRKSSVSFCHPPNDQRNSGWRWSIGWCFSPSKTHVQTPNDHFICMQARNFLLSWKIRLGFRKRQTICIWEPRKQCIFLCVYVCEYAWVKECMCVGQGTICKSRFSLSTYQWDPGNELTSSTVVASTFTLWTISPAWRAMYLEVMLIF